ncbi:hypothetical protein NDU88_003754 [Pleurodeles waltl]|uniref:Uncharacterized protein n=1 Tax=Pleurodeles waltl TaxID=8319 RepID=A0AAV7NHJ4_PLEWA|nr:hypothetical protein NDU88_003754 [Pleurodeles waltl]
MAEKHTRQILFSEAIYQPCSMASPATPMTSGPTASVNDADLDTATERILQEIAAVGHRLEAMDSKIMDLSTVSHSIRSDFASFHEKVTNLDHCLTEVEGQLTVLLECDSELHLFHAKLTDLEDRSQRDNVCFFGVPERKEGTDIRAYLKDLLLELTGPTYSLALEFQRAHRISLIHKADLGKSHPVIAYFLPDKQARQVITAVRAYCPNRMEGSDIRMAEDFFRKTNENRRAFLALRPQLRDMNIKFGLFEPACMWIMQDGISRDLFMPAALSSF